MGKVNGRKMIKIQNQISILAIMSWTKSMGRANLIGKAEIIILEAIRMI
jgi:hypothetical protein